MPDAPAHICLSGIYSDHHRWLRTWLHRKLGDEYGAADLAHDTFLRLLTVSTLPSFGSVGEVRAYLRTTANRLCINLWQRREVERAWHETLAVLSEDHYPSAEHQVLILQALDEVATMLSGLPPKVAEAFVLAEACGMTDLEVATRMQISERSVRNYVAKAMLASLRLRAGETARALSCDA